MQMLGLTTYRKEKSNETSIRNVPHLWGYFEEYLCGEDIAISWWKSVNKCNSCSETVVIRLKVGYVFRITQENHLHVA